MNAGVFALTVYNGELIAAGAFSVAGGQVVNGIAAWDGQAWHGLGGGMNTWVVQLTVYNGELIASGDFDTAGGVPVDSIARWNGKSWQPMGNGSSGNSFLRDFLEFEGDLYAARSFDIFRWNGTEWEDIGVPVNGGTVTTLGTYDGELIAGGRFTSIDGRGARGIAKRSNDTGEWLPFGMGFDGGFYEPRCIVTFNGKLVMGGSITVASGQPVHDVVSWDGKAWQSVGEGLPGGGGIGALVVHGDELIAGGGFQIDDPPINYIASWKDCYVCVADINEDKDVNVNDLLEVINAWGDCPADPPWCSPDVSHNDYLVNVHDLNQVVIGWGPCRPTPIPVPCYFYGDIAPCGGDGVVGIDDLLKVINNWGPWEPPPPPPCPTDISHDGNVGVDDLLMVINAWGDCNK